MKAELEMLAATDPALMLEELPHAATKLFSRIDFTAPPAVVAKAFRSGRAKLLEAAGMSDDRHPSRATAERIIKRQFKTRRRVFARQAAELTPVLLREEAVRAEVERLEIRADAAAEVARRQRGEREPLASLVRSVRDLEAMPEPRWLIDRVMPCGGLVFLVGPSGVGKSALLLSMALASASGRRWLGRDTVAGRWLIIVGEGQGGTPKRVAAERAVWGGDEPAIDFLFMQVDLTDDAQADELAELVAQGGYVGVAWDTLNAHAGAAEENSATAMAHVVRNIARIAGSDATSVVVHHHGKAGTIRGSSALYASADVVLELTGEPAYLTLAATKSKDSAGGRVGEFRLTTSPRHDSVHVEVVTPGTGAPSGARAGRVEEALEHFVRAFAETGATRTQLTEQLIEVMGVQRSAAANYIGALISAGRLHVENRARGSSFLTLAPTPRNTLPIHDKE